MTACRTSILRAACASPWLGFLAAVSAWPAFAAGAATPQAATATAAVTEAPTTIYMQRGADGRAVFSDRPEPKAVIERSWQIERIDPAVAEQKAADMRRQAAAVSERVQRSLDEQEARADAEARERARLAEQERLANRPFDAPLSPYGYGGYPGFGGGYGGYAPDGVPLPAWQRFTPRGDPRERGPRRADERGRDDGRRDRRLDPRDAPRSDARNPGRGNGAANPPRLSAAPPARQAAPRGGSTVLEN